MTTVIRMEPGNLGEEEFLAALREKERSLQNDTTRFMAELDNALELGLWTDREEMYRLSQLPGYDEDILFGEMADRGIPWEDFAGSVDSDPEMEIGVGPADQDGVKEVVTHKYAGTREEDMSGLQGMVQPKITYHFTMLLMSMMMALGLSRISVSGTSVKLTRRERTVRLHIKGADGDVVLISNGKQFLMVTTRNVHRTEEMVKRLVRKSYVNFKEKYKNKIRNLDEWTLRWATPPDIIVQDGCK